MATLIFTALGSLVGGPLGGAIGALAGRQLDALILGPKAREGPRLKELAVTTSSYGTAIPRHFGRVRAAGTIVWATDLVEHKGKQGNGKGRPATVTYSYTASFAVALASRPIDSLGRIWADGNLLRGAGGDLKVSGTMRLYTGAGDQLPDPLIAAAETAAACPAFRGLAYVVFEDLELGDFGNRIPALTFEVIADEGEITLAELCAGVIPEADAAVPLPGLAGLSCEGPLAETLALLDPVYPLDCAAGERLTLAPERYQAGPLTLPDPASAHEPDQFGRLRGFARKRAPETESPLAALRYYDLERDYQPGVQRAPGRPAPGAPRTIELPATLTASTARSLVEGAARRTGWARQTLQWRAASLDPALVPGALVTAPGIAGRWRLREWEWRTDGVELGLVALPPALSAEAFPADPGRAGLPADLPAAATALAAFELPWDGLGSGAQPAIFAAASSAGAGWSGAALFADPASGELVELGPSGRTRCPIGIALGALGPSSPLVLDRSAAVEIELIDPAMILAPATPRQLAAGANRALLGEEILQFASAESLGAGRWRLGGLLRGRGGTEPAVDSHAAGERFVLLDGTATALDPALVGTAPDTRIAALGLGDPELVSAPIAQRGITLRPLCPVHGTAMLALDGTLHLAWTRRARGAWLWLDGVDVPLGESREAWDVTFGLGDSPVARWEPAEAALDLSAAQLAELAVAAPGGRFLVRQRGDAALSQPLVVPLP